MAIGTETAPAAKSSVRIAWRWLPTVLWVLMLCLLSSSYFSAAHTRHLAAFLSNFFHMLHITGISMYSINLLLRKTAHFSLYAGFFLVLIHGPLEGHPYRAILVCIVAGALDETHQLFLLGRTPSIYDVALDSSGAIFGRFLYSAIFLA